MQWTEIAAQDDPGQTFAADVPGGILIRTIGPSTTSALTFIPATTVSALLAPPSPPPTARVDPNTLDPESRALYDRITAADPRATDLTNEQFDLVRTAIDAATA